MNNLASLSRTHLSYLHKRAKLLETNLAEKGVERVWKTDGVYKCKIESSRLTSTIGMIDEVDRTRDFFICF